MHCMLDRSGIVGLSAVLTLPAGEWQRRQAAQMVLTLADMDGNETFDASALGTAKRCCLPHAAYRPAFMHNVIHILRRSEHLAALHRYCRSGSLATALITLQAQSTFLMTCTQMCACRLEESAGWRALRAGGGGERWRTTTWS